MRGGRRVSDGGAHVAQVARDRDQLGRVDHLPGGVLAALHLERHQRAARALLARRERVLRVRFETGVVHARHLWMLLEPARQLQRALRLREHPQFERLHAAVDDPGIEGRNGRPGGAQEADHAVHDWPLGAADRAAQHPALAVEMLGCRMHDEIGAEFDRPLQRRRAQHVVHRKHGTRLFRQRGQRGDVGDLAERVGGGLQEQELRVRPQRALPLAKARGRHEGRLDAELREQRRIELHGGAEHGVRTHHVLARLEHHHRQAQDRGHAGGGRDAGVRAFERGEPVLHHGHGGIGIARVDELVAGTAEAGRGRGRALEHEARRQVQRLGMLAEFAALRAGADA